MADHTVESSADDDLQQENKALKEKINHLEENINNLEDKLWKARAHSDASKASEKRESRVEDLAQQLTKLEQRNTAQREEMLYRAKSDLLELANRKDEEIQLLQRQVDEGWNKLEQAKKLAEDNLATEKNALVAKHSADYQRLQIMHTKSESENKELRAKLDTASSSNREQAEEIRRQADQYSKELQQMNQRSKLDSKEQVGTTELLILTIYVFIY